MSGLNFNLNYDYDYLPGEQAIHSSRPINQPPLQAPNLPQEQLEKRKHERLSFLKIGLELALIEKLGIHLSSIYYETPAGFYREPRNSCARPWIDFRERKSTFLRQPTWQLVPLSPVYPVLTPKPESSQTLVHPNTFLRILHQHEAALASPHAHDTSLANVAPLGSNIANPSPGPPTYYFAWPPAIQSTFHRWLADGGSRNNDIIIIMAWVMFNQVAWVHFFLFVCERGVQIPDKVMAHLEECTERHTGVMRHAEFQYPE